jgi:tRNA(His) guanylyltransferase
MSKDALGDRMKGYEMAEAGRCFMPRLPIVIRIDGRCFHTFTHGLSRPYHAGLAELMSLTTRALVEETGALVGYTQSDEITLVLWTEDPKSQVWFDGRIAKIVSCAASFATAVFVSRLAEHVPEKAGALPTFDARAWNVPGLDEAANVLLWREQDAVKNSISMAASTYYAEPELEGRTSKERQELLFARGINWNDYPARFKRGSYALRRTVQVRYEAGELAALPPRHAARQNPDLTFERSRVVDVELPPLPRIANRVGVLFRGEPPIEADAEIGVGLRVAAPVVG